MKTCKKCNSIFPTSEIIDGKRRNFSKRQFCLKCSPFGTHNTQNLSSPNVKFEKDGKTYKTCPCCKLTLELTADNYYIRKDCKGFHYYCKLCQDSKTIFLQRRKKQVAVDYKGGKCVICGYNKYNGSLDFHHLDPSKKDFAIGTYRTYDMNLIKPELDKCILVCRNCHGEIHGKIIPQSELLKYC
jgi:hypothetical protein